MEGGASCSEHETWTPRVHSLLLLLPPWGRGAVAMVRRDTSGKATGVKTDVPELMPDFTSQLPSAGTPWPMSTQVSASPTRGKKRFCAPFRTVGTLTKYLNLALEYRIKLGLLNSCCLLVWHEVHILNCVSRKLN